jgi:hypothetical protein
MLLGVSNVSTLGNSIEAELARLLPPAWMIQLDLDAGFHPFDGRFEILAPNGSVSRFLVELKTRFEPRDVDRLSRASAPNQRILLVAPSLTARSRQVLKDHDICYADLLGNVWLSSESVLVDRTGAEKRLIPEKQHSRSSLRGPVTARVVRYLCDTLPPLRVRGIANATHAHAGNVSRILELLERELLIKRADNGSVVVVDWEPLIMRWASDLEKEREFRTFLEPRGLSAFVPLLSVWNGQYAVTGSYASAQLAPVIDPIAIDIYVENIDVAREHLSLRYAQDIGNVRLIRAFDPVVFQRTLRRRDLTLAGPSQIAADLVTMRKRSEDELLELFTWMKRHESEWRSESK